MGGIALLVQRVLDHRTLALWAKTLDSSTVVPSSFAKDLELSRHCLSRASLYGSCSGMKLAFPAQAADCQFAVVFVARGYPGYWLIGSSAPASAARYASHYQTGRLAVQTEYAQMVRSRLELHSVQGEASLVP